MLVSDGLWYLHRPNRSAAEFGTHLPFFNGLASEDAEAMLEKTGFAGAQAWHDRFDTHPYGTAYDDPERQIEFFVLTARKALS